MTNSRNRPASSSSIPPGKTLLVVISRSCGECHMRQTGFGIGWIRDRAKAAWCRCCRQADRCIRTEIGTATRTRTVRDGRIRQSLSDRHLQRRRMVRLHWLFDLAPLEIVDCSGGTGVVAVPIRACMQRKIRGSVVTIRDPSSDFAGPVEDSITREAGSCCRGEEQPVQQDR